MNLLKYIYYISNKKIYRYMNIFLMNNENNIQPQTLTQNEILKNAFYDAIIQKAKEKLVIILIIGKSGSGKSLTMLKLVKELQERASLLLNKQFEFNIDKQFVFTPTQYGERIENFLNDKSIFTFGVDEMRHLIGAKNWTTLLNRSIADANATFRQIKEHNCGFYGIAIYNTQFPKDIDIDVRRTIDFIIHMRDWKGHKGFFIYTYEYNFYLDDFFIKRFSFKLGDLEITPIVITTLIEDRNLINEFNLKMVEAKTRILRHKFKVLLSEIKKELGEDVFIEDILENDKTFEFVKNLASFSEKRGVYFTPEKKEIIMRLFNLDKKGFSDFLKKFEDACRKRGLI